MTHVVMVDNRDSFTWNVVHLLHAAGAEVTVLRSDLHDAADVAAVGADLVVISPGPGGPATAGCSLDVISALAGTTPIFGVCLGLQCIGEAFGGEIVRAGELVHGKTDAIHHEGAGVFAGVPSPFEAVRYHSLVIDRRTLPDCLDVTAATDTGLIMGARHRELAVEGVQFHPESILTEHGDLLARNILAMARGATTPMTAGASA